MKTRAVLILVMGLAGTAHAADGPPGLSAQGEGQWELICRVVAGSVAKSVLLSPGHGVFADPRLARAECDYHAGPAGVLTISATGADSCPFAGASGEACTLSVPASGRGSFKFLTKPR